MKTLAFSIFQGLRPPSAKPLLLKAGFSARNVGHAYQLQTGEPAVAAGDGVVESIRSTTAAWSYTSPSLLDTLAAFEVVINHGQEIRTLVHGLSETQGIAVGSRVVRGYRLGSSLTGEVFFQVWSGNAYLDPSSVNKHFRMQSSSVIPAWGGYVKQAPDVLARSYVGSTISAMVNGIRKFVNSLKNTPLLINIAFNGSGSKVGLAATGYSTTDYWNLYTPNSFTELYGYSYACESHTKTYSSNPTVPLLGYTQKSTSVALEKLVEPADSGTAASWDALLTAWVGGIPAEETFFYLRGLPAGSYSLYLYSNQGATDFYAAVNDETPTLKSNDPTSSSEWLEGKNYVRYALTLPSSAVVTVKSLGYISGLQIIRV